MPPNVRVGHESEPSLDFHSAGRGKSWECATSGHGGCQLAGCVCPCHYHPETSRRSFERVQTDPSLAATPPTDVTTTLPPKDAPVCPKCGAVANAGDRFCRRDGTTLQAAQNCPKCNAEAGMSDLYCGSCGAPLSSEISIR